MEFDPKAELILEHYKKIIEHRMFNEYDILGFLIFIRTFANASRYPFIHDFCDLIAHRNREWGNVMDCIKSCVLYHCETLPGTNIVKGYHGMRYTAWEEEWNKLGLELGIRLSAIIIIEITICVFSLAQYTVYDDKKGNRGRIELCQNDYSLALTTVADGEYTFFVCFAEVKVFDMKKKYPFGHIDEIVETERTDGILHLKTATAYII